MTSKKNKQPTDPLKTEKVGSDPKLSSNIPVKGSFPVIGIGASAGGLAAFGAFFSGMPADKSMDMAFLLVQHLAPDHKSILTELLQQYTPMTVIEVEDGVTVQANCVYVIPPNRNMAFIDGTLQLLEPVAPRGHRFPIDFLFRSLAQDLHEQAICIILSGTGSDGTLGLREIKGEGGMAMVQSLESCGFDGMLKNAIDTGLVDYVLPPEDMAAQLLAFTAHAFSRPRVPNINPQPQTDSLLKKLFVLLRDKTGHDFSGYKQSTIIRRIERRMAVHQIAKLDGYVKYMQQTPKETEMFFRDLLIGVTDFFRDPEAFAELEKVIDSGLFDNKDSGSELRVWVCGCSTGEEAYSIAILLQEKLESLSHQGLPSGFKVQLFASDINQLAIEQARQGFFSESIAKNVTPARLERYFSFDAKTKTYRIQKRIRNTIIFSEQDVIKDPPFSKLDLISCRNLMIYMGPTLQKKMISLFHFALNPGGFLFLGTSETIGEMTTLFTMLDRKQKLYQRKTDGHIAKHPSLALSLPLIATARQSNPKVLPYNVSLQELAEKALLQQVVQAGVLVNRKGDILYLHGRAGMYLEPVTGGLDSYNILKMAREGLQAELVVALHQAALDNTIVRRSSLRVKTNAHFSTINLTISPVEAGLAAESASTLFMVVLEEAASQLESSTNVSTTSVSPDSNAQIVKLEQALLEKDSYIQSVSEEQQAAFEELKSVNEELQSINEELQSTNEELETSKEELQSVNEELATTNAELQNKALESSHLSNDMNNLIVGTGIATIFVDLELKILRFTPGLTKIISLIESDIGRPLKNFTSTISVYNQLENDLQSMLHSLIPRELEVQTIDGNYYMLGMLPYRTTDNRIEGAVINFINITEQKQAEISLKKANDQMRLATVVRDANDAILLQDLDGNIMAWNGAAQKLYGWSETEALALNIAKLVPADLHKKELSRIKQLSQKEILETYETKRLTKDGLVIDVWLTATGLINKTGEVYAIATTERHNKKSLGRKLKA
ncbi:chemotaxis protein CheB [Paraglaciecola sp. 25GB23A]|uniref:chemotaxis protein CheB n=1 Tax=Paraglaciecola sp. 25GB23A TaxID=3156068 RepID=UPI0032B00901